MVQEKNIIRLGLTIIMFIALIGLVSTPALAHGGGGHHWKPAACSKTASSAYLACQYEVKDDYWIAKGNCYNATEDQAECFAEAKEEYKEAKGECRDQLDARKDLCEDLGEDPYDPDIVPADFVLPENIGSSSAPANPYFPLVTGNTWTYQTTEDGEVTETITVEVLDETITIQGVECVVVRDIVYDGDTADPTGEHDIIEDTYDWYGQKIDGTILYFGEFSLAKEDCEPDDDLCEGLYTEDGSWKSGYAGAKAGIIMFAHPSLEVGTVFRQELSLGNAEDAAEVLSFGGVSVTVPAGTFATGVLKTLDFTPIDPDARENKYYAPGVGVIKEEALDEDGAPAGEVVELIEFTTS